ncbi:MAG: hypothetical protein HAW67_06050 [Endozoicomonadaceae bacterium]|nr:hypothetical protein [Endozoicomonadaceae bacterium]
MVTSLCFDDGSVDIGLNNNGEHDDFTNSYDEFTIFDLRVANSSEI